MDREVCPDSTAHTVPCLRCDHPRLNGSCHSCPNTAWLLFLLFSLGLVALVALSVYLSKKRLNLSGLGIGVVSAMVCVAFVISSHKGA